MHVSSAGQQCKQCWETNITVSVMQVPLGLTVLQNNNNCYNIWGRGTVISWVDGPISGLQPPSALLSFDQVWATYITAKPDYAVSSTPTSFPAAHFVNKCHNNHFRIPHPPCLSYIVWCAALTAAKSKLLQTGIKVDLLG